MWGVQPVVDNRPGGGSNIGFEAAARSPADGYTLLMATPAFTVNVSLYRKLGYDPIRDFEPISLLCTYPLVMLVHPTVPAKSLEQFLALARARPNAINFASAGNGTTPHLAVELLKTLAGIKVQHIPYKGAAPAVTDLIGGHVEAAFTSPPTVLAHIRSGKLRAVALTGAVRSQQLPEVPTFKEAGLPGFVVEGSYGVVAPAGTPRDIVSRLNADINKALGMQALRERMISLTLDPQGGTVAEFGAYLKSEVGKWAKVVQASGARAD